MQAEEKEKEMMMASRLGGGGGLLTGGEINELWDEKLESTETYGQGAVWNRDEDRWLQVYVQLQSRYTAVPPQATLLISDIYRLQNLKK